VKRVFVTVTIAALLGACGAHHDRSLSTIVRRGPTGTVVAIGAGITAGDGASDALRDAWPRLVFNETFAVGSVFVNAATRDATFASAVTDQVPLVRQVHPDTVLVWLGPNDVSAHVPAEDVGRAVHDLVDGLRAAGARRVLVASLPSIQGSAATQPIDSAITTSARAAGASVVDLHGVRVQLDAAGEVVASDGLNRAVADAFERALRTS
jgi:lysophospholipase L1-like esterase